jgi:two-component sensor histidine kinase
MQIIYSLLRLQSRCLKNEEAKKLFEESQNRIRSMALIHEKLYLSEDLSSIDFRGYIVNLVNSLAMSYGISTNNISLITDVEDVSFGMETAVPCGLIINELVSNSFKYAFPRERRGEVRVALEKRGGDEVELLVSDNGVGLPEGMDFRSTESFGFQLVTSLVEGQLNGAIVLDATGGTGFRIRFRELKYRKRI